MEVNWSLITCALALASAAGWLRAADPAAPLDFNLYMQGKHVYERNCIVCHGVRGDGRGELAPTLKPRPRSFREGMFKFRSTPLGKLPTDEDLRRTIRGGLSGTAMGMFTQLADAELEAVMTYVKSFSRRWRRAENYAPPIGLPLQPAWFSEAGQLKARTQAGQKVFALHCAACHGEKADGKGPVAGTLKDIWGEPSAPTDLRQTHLRCGDGARDVFRLLSTGMNGTPMMSFDPVLTEVQRWEVIAYLFSLRQADEVRTGEPPR